MVTEKMNKLCALLTATAKKVKKEDDATIFIAGLDAQEKLHLSAVVIGVRASNRHQMGILVNALREQDATASYTAAGMCLTVEITDKASGRIQEALYVCLEDRFGNAEDVIFPWKKKRFGGFELDRPTSQVTEPRVYGPKGDELVALVKEKVRVREAVPVAE